MEVIPKRFRSGSISSRLRSASELLDEGVLENRQQKGLLKDLIISGDEALADALTRYERGDKEPIKLLVREGVLNRKSSLDLLGDVGDLSFDFLSVSTTAAFPPTVRSTLDVPFPMDEDEMTFEILVQETDAYARSPPRQKLFPHGSFNLGRAQLGLRSASLSSMPGTPTFGSSRPISIPSRVGGSSVAQIGQSAYALGTPPPDLFEISIMDENGLGAWAHPALRGFSRKEELEFESDDLDESPPSSPKHESVRRVATYPPPAPKPSSTLKLRRSTVNKASVASSATSAPIVIPRQAKTTGRVATSASKRSSGAYASAVSNAGAASGTLSDERATSRRTQGVAMVGAYSPESRRERVERFVAKRDRRVWKKKVKYDVRKNFADSRLRVKGRFVKKEDEEMLRDLMTMV